MDKQNPNKNPEIIVAGNRLLEVGKVYEVRHSRKGTFCMRIKSIDDEWIRGTIVSGGVAKAVMSYNVKYDGDEITVRDVHSYFILVENWQEEQKA